MADIQIIKSYLVSLGFQVENRTLTQFTEALKKVATQSELVANSMAKGFVGAGIAVTGALAGITAGFVGLMDHVAQNDLDMQVFARRMFLSTDAARKMKTATDALGYSIEEIIWGPPELAERYRTLIADQNKMLSAIGGTDFEKQMRHLRDIRFEFTRLGVGMQYFAMAVVKDLSKALWGDENALQQKLEKFVTWFMDNMPRLAENFSTKIAPSLHNLGDAFGHLADSLSKIDWATLITNILKVMTEMTKLLDWVVSHPTFEKLLIDPSFTPDRFGASLFGGKEPPKRGFLDDFYDWAVGNKHGGNLKGQIANTARRYGVDPALMLGLIQKESNFNPNAVNPQSGAMGLGQFMPGTARMYGLSNPYDASQNMDATARYLRDLLARHGGDVGAALKDYGGFQNADPSGYINDIMRYRNSYTGDASLNPTAYHQSVGDINIHITNPNATPEQIHAAVKSALDEKLGFRDQRMLAQRQGVFA